MKILIFVLLSFVGVMESGWAGCGNPRSTTPTFTDSPTVTPFGAVNLVCDLSAPSPGFTESWSWEYNGIVSENTAGFSISTIATGLQEVLFHHESCNENNECGGGTQKVKLYVGKRPTISFSSATCNSVPGFYGTRIAYIPTTYNMNDTNPNVAPINTQWEVLSGPGSFSGGTDSSDAVYLTGVKGASIGRARARVRVDYVDEGGNSSFFVNSDPVDVSVSCPNVGPSVTSISGWIDTVSVGSTVNYWANGIDADGDQFKHYRYYVLGKPEGSTITNPEPRLHPNKELSFTPDVAGTYVLGFTISDTEDAESEVFEKTITAVLPPVEVPNFKIKLVIDENNESTDKEYLFDDCSPFPDHPCRAMASTHEGGEFLIGDKIKLDARENTNPEITKYIWTIDGIAEPIETTNPVQIWNIPISEPKDISISLKVEINGVQSDPKVKQIRAEKEIKVGYDTYFNQGGNHDIDSSRFGESKEILKCGPVEKVENADRWFCRYGPNDIGKIITHGCVLTALANIFHWKLPRIPDVEADGHKLGPNEAPRDPENIEPKTATNPYTLNKLFNRRVEANYSGRGVLWAANLNTYNAYLENPDHRLNYLGRQQLTDETERFQKAKEFARKRKIRMLEVPSPGVLETRDEDSLSESWQKKSHCFDYATKKLKYESYQECLDNTTHYLILDGIEYDENSKNSDKLELQILDPGKAQYEKFYQYEYVNRALNQARNFTNKLRGFRVFNPPNSTLVAGQTIRVSIDNPEIALSLTAPDGSSIRKGKNSRNQGLIGNITRTLISSLEGDSGEEGTVGGDEIEVPNFTQLGTYNLSLTSSTNRKGNLFIDVVGQNGERLLRRLESISVLANQAKIVPFNVSDEPAKNGIAIINSVNVSTDPKTKKKIFKISGSFNLANESDGLDFSSDEINFSVNGIGEYLTSNNLNRSSNRLAYKNTNAVEGLKSLEVNRDLTFIGEVLDLSTFNLFKGEVTNIEISVGNDIFSGRFGIEKLINNEILSVELDKFEYQQSERFTATIIPLLQLDDKEREFYLSAEIDGQRNLVMDKANANGWIVKSPKLLAGQHQLSLKLYTQDARSAKSIKQAVQQMKQRIFSIEEELAQETDPEIIDNLTKEKMKLLSRIEFLEKAVENTRRQIGDVYEKTVTFN